MRSETLAIFLIVSVSIIPFGFSEKNENVTKQDIMDLKNELNSLESKYNYSTQEIKDEINQIISLIDSLDQKLSTHKEDLQSAFSVTGGISNIQLFVSITSGATIALVTMIIGYLISDLRNKKTVKTFLKHDFNDVNDRVVILMTNLRNTIREIGPNNTIVNSLFNHTETPRVFMRRFLTGLLFFRWDAAVSNMNSLSPNEVEIISKLHGFIIKIDELPQLDISLVSETINLILNSNDTEQRQRQLISDALRIDLTTRLQHYDKVFHTMRDDLAPIKWINLSDEHFK